MSSAVIDPMGVLKSRDFSRLRERTAALQGAAVIVSQRPDARQEAGDFRFQARRLAF
jgi:hypothetical protein